MFSREAHQVLALEHSQITPAIKTGWKGVKERPSRCHTAELKDDHEKYHEFQIIKVMFFCSGVHAGERLTLFL